MYCDNCSRSAIDWFNIVSGGAGAIFRILGFNTRGHIGISLLNKIKTKEMILVMFSSFKMAETKFMHYKLFKYIMIGLLLVQGSTNIRTIGLLGIINIDIVYKSITSTLKSELLWKQSDVILSVYIYYLFIDTKCNQMSLKMPTSA